MVSYNDKRAAVEEISKRNGGRPSAELLLEAARDRGHILHSEFNWDDKSAAEKHRLDQAREIIRSVRVAITI